jgi:hypothetical protein
MNPRDAFGLIIINEFAKFHRGRFAVSVVVASDQQRRTSPDLVSHCFHFPTRPFP